MPDRDLAHRASHACAGELDDRDAFVLDLDEAHIATVGLDVRTDLLHRLGHALEERATGVDLWWGRVVHDVERTTRAGSFRDPGGRYCPRRATCSGRRLRGVCPADNAHR